MNYEILDNAMKIKCQPGLVGQRVNDILAPYGRKIGPDPASINAVCANLPTVDIQGNNVFYWAQPLAPIGSHSVCVTMTEKSAIHHIIVVNQSRRALGGLWPITPVGCAAGWPATRITPCTAYASC